MLKSKKNILYIMSILLILNQFCYPFRDIISEKLLTLIGIFFIFLVYLSNYKNLNLNLIIIINLITFIRILISGNISLNYFSPINRLISFFLLLEAYSLFLFLKNLNLKKKKYIINLILLSVLITVVISLYYIFYIDKQAIRNTQRDYLFAVGDFELMYTLSFIQVGMFNFMKKNKKIFIILTFIFLLTILKSNLVTSSVIYFLTFFIGIFIFLTNKYRKIVLTFISSIVIGFFILKDLFASLFYNLSKSNFFYWSTQNKLVAISNLIKGNFKDLDTLNMRAELMRQSFKTFSENIFFGVDFKNIKQGIIGGHSEWPDLLAQFGIIGFIIIIIIFYRLYKEQEKRYCNTGGINSIKLAWILFIILGFLNPSMMGATMFTIFIYVPFAVENRIDYIEKN